MLLFEFVLGALVEFHGRSKGTCCFKKSTLQLSMVVHACNPSYTGDRGRKIMV
jgi:hypothetical protein